MPAYRNRPRVTGFTLIEILVVIAIIGVLVTLTFHGTRYVQQRARIARAAATAALLDVELGRYLQDHGCLPGAGASSEAACMEANAISAVLRDLEDGYARAEVDQLYVRHGDDVRPATDGEIQDRACDKVIVDPWHEVYLARENLSNAVELPCMRRPDFLDLYSKGPNGRDDTLLLVRGRGDDDVGNW